MFGPTLMRKLQNSGSSIFHRPTKAKWHKLQHLQSFTFKLHRSQVTLCSPCVHHVFTMCSPCVHHVFTMCSPCSQWGSSVDSTVKIVRLLWNIHNHSLQQQNLNGHCQDIAGLWFSTAGYTKQQAHAKTIQNQQVRPAREMPGRCQLPRKLATHILSIGKASLPQSPEAGEAGEALRTFTSNIIHDYTLFNTYPIDIQQIITQHLFNTADWVRRNSIAASRGLKMFEDVWGPVYSQRRWSRANPGKPRW